MTRDELQGVIDWLDSMGTIEGCQTADFLRQIADAQPVAWMHDGFLSRNREMIDHDETRNRICGFEAKPIFTLYTLPLED